MDKLQYLFLGYNERETRLINFLKEKKIQVKNLDGNVSFKDAQQADLIISFGYKKLLKKEIISKLRRPAINLHMSLLAYNRGSHPNFWSFLNRTPKGITIHEVDCGADTGNIIFQKEFDLDPNFEKYSTFKKTYDFLFLELENLFIDHFDKIVAQNYNSKKQEKVLPLKKDSDLPSNIDNWDIDILKYLNK